MDLSGFHNKALQLLLWSNDVYLWESSSSVYEACSTLQDVTKHVSIVININISHDNIRTL